MNEEQSGFQKGYSTVDQIFSLCILGEKYLSKNKGRLFMAFIDFSRAFDQIPVLDVLLFSKLIKNGFHGKVLQLLKSMYSILKIRKNTTWIK